jgi:hypothetical protein
VLDDPLFFDPGVAAPQFLSDESTSANVYDSGFVNGDCFDTTTSAGSKDGLNFNGNVGIGPYSVVIFTQ